MAEYLFLEVKQGLEVKEDVMVPLLKGTPASELIGRLPQFD